MKKTVNSAAPPAEVSYDMRSRFDWLVLTGFGGFLFFFGLGYFGLVGADEPRYAQVAREMFARHDWITPTLGGLPWLEKPVFYYWEAMLSYSVFGVSDWAARLPSAADATVLVVGIYLFLRRFCRGYELDGALITASSAAVIGFARAASTDMPLAAMFGVAMLAWYAWCKGQSRKHLSLFYVFLGFATLAKGPVAPFLAGLIILIFSVTSRNAAAIWRTLWIPGILVFCVVTLPWYIAVQVRNPEFVRVFFIEHNLARFGTTLYHHIQPFWYFVPVAIASLVPWIVIEVRALIRVAREWWTNKREPATSAGTLPVFLLIWFVVPIVFFSISKSKLPGYILPALPAASLLVVALVARTQRQGIRFGTVAIIMHSLLAGGLLLPAFMIRYIVIQHRLPWNRAAAVSSAIAMVAAAMIAVGLYRRQNIRMLRVLTMLPVLLAVAIILRIGAPALDETLSARPVANEINLLSAKRLPLAVFKVSRETEFGLAFYRDQIISRYEFGSVPREEHLVIAPSGSQAEVAKRVAERRVSYLGSFAAQRLEYYWVSPESSRNPRP
ncbi:MAG: glycosyltransferase family 39 protein [Acidobacteriota bacterium]|nr:glycosyltransferase family 39 protein [Acidobacteriota bacterium]